MPGRRPPDILRKSHAHTEGKTRAKDKRRLREEADESVGDRGDRKPAGKRPGRGKR